VAGVVDGKDVRARLRKMFTTVDMIGSKKMDKREKNKLAEEFAEPADNGDVTVILLYVDSRIKAGKDSCMHVCSS
jgi:hypothetical protein